MYTLRCSNPTVIVIYSCVYTSVQYVTTQLTFTHCHLDVHVGVVLKISTLGHDLQITHSLNPSI